MCIKKWPVIVFLSLLTLTQASCIRSSLDDCYQWMRIELRWMFTNPVSYSENVKIEVVPLTPDAEYEITSDVYGVNVNLRVGEYRLIGHEVSPNVTIDYDDLTVAVATGPDGMALQPSIFSAGSSITEVKVSDKDLTIPLPMYKQSRELIIGIDFEGDAAPLISSINGVLSGITIKRELDNGFPPVNQQTRPPAITSGSIAYDFNPLTTRAVGDEWFAGSKTLLGVDGNSNQIINLDVQFNDGTTTTSIIDLTEPMEGFHTVDINEPWYIIITVEAGIGLSVEIVDWLSGPESWVIAQ